MKRNAQDEEYLETFDLEAYLESEGVVFKLSRGRSGQQMNVQVCPDCGNRDWKLFLNQETGIGNCFTCPRGFNKVSFVHAHLGKPAWRDVFQVIRQAARDQGWRPKRMVTASVEAEKATMPMSFALPTPEGMNLKYLEERGVTGALAAYFHLRWCENGFWKYQSDEGETKLQNFQSRVIIPVFDLEGEFVTYQGRDVTGAAKNKYLFPKGLPGTGRYLFNGQNAGGARRVCMGEGAFDVIAMKIAFDEAMDMRDIVPIGSFGKHLSDGDGNDQLTRLRRLRAVGLREVTIMWDGEKNALTAALDAAKKVVKLGLVVRIALLPPGKDPNETTTHIVRQAFRKAQTYSTLVDLKLRLQNPFASARI